MQDGEFPPGLRYTGFMAHGLSLVHDSAHEALSTTILLRSVWHTLQDFSSSIFKSFKECVRLVLSPSIRHPFLDVSTVLCFNHSRELLQRCNSGAFLA